MGVPALSSSAKEVSQRPGLPAGVPLAVMACASVVGLASAMACGLWLYPDSRGYVQMAADIAERFDYSSDLFLIRTPGYPVMLAVIFAVFGRASPVAILALQHVMVVAIAVLTCRVAWALTADRRTALLAGLFCAFNVELLGFANVIMTEAAFTLLVTACVLYLLRFMSRWRLSDLAWASTMCGAAYLVRPIGLVLMMPCLVAAAWGWRRRRRCPTDAFSSKGRATFGLAVSCLVPAAIVSGPVLLHRATAFGPQPAGWRLRTALYLRAAVVEGFDAPGSAALQEIKRATAQDVRDGLLTESVDHRQRLRAVRQVLAHSQGASFAESSAIIGQAGWDLFQSHRGKLLTGTVTHAARTLLMPDGTYRHVPRAGVPAPAELSGTETLLDVAAYDSMIRPYIAERILHRYLPLEPTPGLLTPAWSSAMGWFHRLIVNGPGVPLLGDSPYELAMVLCVVGGLLGLATPRRRGWLLMGLTVAVLVIVPAFFCGTVPRYAVPVHPLLAVCGAHVAVAVGPVAYRLLRRGHRLRPIAESTAARPAPLRA